MRTCTRNSSSGVRRAGTCRGEKTTRRRDYRYYAIRRSILVLPGDCCGRWELGALLYDATAALAGRRVWRKQGDGPATGDESNSNEAARSRTHHMSSPTSPSEKLFDCDGRRSDGIIESIGCGRCGADNNADPSSERANHHRTRSRITRSQEGLGYRT